MQGPCNPLACGYPVLAASQRIAGIFAFKATCKIDAYLHPPSARKKATTRPQTEPRPFFLKTNSRPNCDGVESLEERRVSDGAAHRHVFDSGLSKKLVLPTELRPGSLSCLVAEASKSRSHSMVIKTLIGLFSPTTSVPVQAAIKQAARRKVHNNCTLWKRGRGRFSGSAKRVPKKEEMPTPRTIWLALLA